MDRLSELEAFSAVVDQGGFTGAAQKLGLSKSAVSKHVSSLEHRLGVRLLNRTTRRVDPTEVGLLYYDRARTVLNAALEADAAVSAVQTDPSGRLTLSAPTEFGTSVLTPILGEYMRLYPQVQIALDLNDRPFDPSDTETEISLRVGSAPEGPFRADPLGKVARVLVASPAYLASFGTPERIEDLSQHELLHCGGNGVDPAWRLVSATGEERVVRGSGRMSANSERAVMRLAMDGLGIAFLPDYLVAPELGNGLQTVLPSLPEQTWPLIAVYRTDCVVQPRVRAFLDMLHAELETDALQAVARSGRRLSVAG